MLRIAVTGANGTIGRRLCADLGRDYQIVGIDRSSADINLDIANNDALRAAFENCHAVIHLAAAVAVHATWDDVQRNNITGTYNVFEAARLAGCQRLIFASSHHVVSMYRRGHPPGEPGDAVPAQLGVDIPPRPDSLYAVSKVFGETLGRYYSDVHGMQVACIRIGSMNEQDSARTARSWRHPWRDQDAERRMVAKWLSHRDFARLVRAILERNVPFAVVYAVGDNAGRFLDLNPGRELFDFTPVDRAQ